MNKLDYEIAHYVSSDLKIYSKARKVSIFINGEEIQIKFPFNFWDFFSFSRLLRRALRIDKCNVFLINKNPLEILMIRRGSVYTFHLNHGLNLVLKLKNCRNLLHVDLCKTKNGELFLGEYGANNKRLSVPIYRSYDNGKTWKIVHEFANKSIKHIHCIKQDPYTEKIWTFTGDDDGECKVVVSDQDFKEIEVLGDGSQKWRACDVFFRP